MWPWPWVLFAMPVGSGQEDRREGSSYPSLCPRRSTATNAEVTAGHPDEPARVLVSAASRPLWSGRPARSGSARRRVRPADDTRGAVSPVPSRYPAHGGTCHV